MKYISVAMIIVVTCGFSCSKNAESTMCPTELTIVSTQTPATATLGNDIAGKASCTGANLCYSFSHIDIKTVTERIFEIRTKGKIDCKASICADAIYNASPSFTIKANLNGQYILRYYNNNTLFKADTVAVN